MLLRKVDEHGYFLEDVIVESIPVIFKEVDGNSIAEYDPHYIQEAPQGLYTPKWDFENKQWVEGKPQSEIDAIKATQQELANQPTLEEYVLDMDYRLTMAELGLV